MERLPLITKFSTTVLTATISATIGLAACAPPEDGDSDGCFGKCDGFGGDVHDVLSSRTDPIARFLLQNDIDDEGFINTDFGAMLLGMAKVQGCDRETIQTFVVSDNLISAEPFPRLVSAACTDNRTKGSEFFMAASFEDFENPGEIDFKSIEAFAWDATKREYQFYVSVAGEDGNVRFNTAPTECRGCHLNAANHSSVAMHMTPVMNELTQPWEHWNSQPGFPSSNFVVPTNAQESDSFAEWVDPWLGQAESLEGLIREGQSKVAGARVRERRDPVDVEKAMGLLRPVFCSEQLNYASEDFNSGLLRGSAVIDPGMGQAFLAVRADNWPWEWLNNTNIRLPAPTGETVKQLPVRGNSDVSVENLLMKTNVLTPEQVLRVRALDYQRPVFSEYRCGLWQEALSRFETATPDLSSATRNSHAIPILFEAIMTLGPRDLKVEDKIVTMRLSGPEVAGALFIALGEGSLTNDCSSGVCALTLDELGAEVQDYYATIASGSGARDFLFAERDRRICRVVAKVKPVDDRFDDPQIQRQCGERCCAEAGLEGDEQCIGQAAAAAKAFDTSRPILECATDCAAPIMFNNRPSLPKVEGCLDDSLFLPGADSQNQK